jgi:hypothetical protein
MSFNSWLGSSPIKFSAICCPTISVIQVNSPVLLIFEIFLALSGNKTRQETFLLADNIFDQAKVLLGLTKPLS